MSTLDNTISDTLLPGVTDQEKWLNCTRNYPWYPLPWLMLAKSGDDIFLQKANLWFEDEQRLHWLLHSKPWQEDRWLTENLKNIIYATNIVDNEEDIVITREVPEDKNEPTSTNNSLETIQESPEASEKTIPNNYLRHSTDLQHNTEITELSKPTGFDGVLPVDALVDTKNPEDDPAVAPSAVVTAAITNTLERGSIESPSTTEPLVFEPYHSVDYFASQGIKLTLPAEPKDKFDRQLKSFTQWLKVMKKVTVLESNAVADPAVDIQANESVSGKEVNTEAMAQVLEKQGKYQKAARIYEKLLLLHPEKSTFFAARIEELKNKQ